MINRGRIVANGTVEDLRREVLPWARVEFRTSANAALLADEIAALPGVHFVENLTAGGEARLRVLSDASAATDVLRDATAAAVRAGASIDDVTTGAAAFEDLFTKLTRGRSIQDESAARTPVAEKAGAA